MRSLNVIQETPYSINNDILEAIEYCWANGARIGKFPTQDKFERPTAPTTGKTWKTSSQRLAHLSP